MGIRFTCHACNKRLNVKAFLAGKRGICPHCASKVDIPWQSIAADNGQGPEASGIVRESIPTSGQSTSGGHQSIPVGVRANNYPANVLPKVPGAVAVSPSAVPTGSLHGQSASPAAVGPTASVSVAKASPPPPPDQVAPNPIDEAPSAVWYVRPPSGGLYGPASGDIMKKWVDEGRVSADSLVWREGWADWKTAESLFTQLGATQSAAPPAPLNPFGGAAPVEVAADNGSPRPYGKRRSNNSLAVVLVVLLTLASLGLFGVLIAVIRYIQ